MVQKSIKSQYALLEKACKAALNPKKVLKIAAFDIALLAFVIAVLFILSNMLGESALKLQYLIPQLQAVSAQAGTGAGLDPSLITATGQQLQALTSELGKVISGLIASLLIIIAASIALKGKVWALTLGVNFTKGFFFRHMTAYLLWTFGFAILLAIAMLIHPYAIVAGIAAFLYFSFIFYAQLKKGKGIFRRIAETFRLGLRYPISFLGIYAIAIAASAIIYWFAAMLGQAIIPMEVAGWASLIAVIVIFSWARIGVSFVVEELATFP
ncbi:TPA: hypothetical protein HA361_07090 [Candidatus Woesearchaeota archaeon]|nr:hypothetical protein [Candidatus Woesearchaeota archaeon]HII68560.1 hypothetical protein [Candidatus Woesearchaeota archaeon]